MSEFRFLRHGLSYAAVGLLQLLLDTALYIALTSMGTASVSANVCSRVSGALLGFWLNGAFTFRDVADDGLKWRHFGRFFVSWCVMLILSTIAVGFVNENGGLRTSWLMKPVIDAFLAGAGFLISRFWIYK